MILIKPFFYGFFFFKIVNICTVLTLLLTGGDIITEASFWLLGSISLKCLFGVDLVTDGSISSYLIKHQSCHHIETSQLIWSANQFTGFYMMATLAFNDLI